MTTLPDSNAPRMIAGFWIRVIADTLDMLVLYLFALALGVFADSWFIRLGERGLWVGLLISVAYFVPMQSRLGDGQSLGKRALGIQVLDLRGQPLSLPKSFVRYLIIAFVAYSGAVSPILGIWLSSILGTFWLILFFGCYLMLPLHPLKRGLHDLVAGSIVVYRGKFDAGILASSANPSRLRKTYLIMTTLALLCISGGVWGILTLSRNPTLATMLTISRNLETTGRFHGVNVSSNTFHSNTASTASLTVLAHVDGPLNQTDEDLKPLFDQAFEELHRQLKDLAGYDQVRVGLRLGYNLGIRKRYDTHFQMESPGKPGERKWGGRNSSY